MEHVDKVAAVLSDQQMTVLYLARTVGLPRKTVKHALHFLESVGKASKHARSPLSSNKRFVWSSGMNE